MDPGATLQSWLHNGTEMIFVRLVNLMIFKFPCVCSDINYYSDIIAKMLFLTIKRQSGEEYLLSSVSRIYIHVTYSKLCSLLYMIFLLSWNCLIYMRAACFGAWDLGPQHGFARISKWKCSAGPSKVIHAHYNNSNRSSSFNIKHNKLSCINVNSTSLLKTLHFSSHTPEIFYCLYGMK